MAKYDWPAIEAEYIAGNMSLRDLEAEKSIPLRTLAGQSKNGGWDAKRQQFRNEVTTQTLARVRDQKILDKTQFDALSERVTDIAYAHARDQLEKIVGADAASMDAGELREIMQALKIAQDIKYRALGIPLPKQPVEHSGAVGVAPVLSAQAEAERIRANREQWKSKQAQA